MHACDPASADRLIDESRRQARLAAVRHDPPSPSGLAEARASRARSIASKASNAEPTPFRSSHLTKWSPINPFDPQACVFVMPSLRLSPLRLATRIRPQPRAFSSLRLRDRPIVRARQNNHRHRRHRRAGNHRFPAGDTANRHPIGDCPRKEWGAATRGIRTLWRAAPSPRTGPTA